MPTKASKPLSAVEEEARQIVARHLGAPVVQHDDNSEPSMPDLRIEYPDRPHAVVEVVRDVFKERAGQRGALDAKGDNLVVAGLSKTWGIELTTSASVRALHRELPTLLQEVEAAGPGPLQAQQRPGLDPLAYRLFELKIRNIHPLGVSGSGPNVILMAPNFGTWDGDSNMIVSWCQALLDQEDDVAAKLAASGFKERHAYLVPTDAGDLMVYRAMFTTPPGFGTTPVIPTATPTLPEGVDRVWVRGLDRAITWAPDTGWVQVASA